MWVRGCFALVCGLVASAAFAADPPSGAEKLPVPKPVPEAAPSLILPLRSPADDAADLSSTRVFDTYVYVLNGADPFHWSGMDCLADRLRSSGFLRTKFGEWYDMGSFEAEYRKVRAENVNARVVLIGFDLGAYMVRASANRLIQDGFEVAMIGYIGGECLTDTEYTRPAAAGRVVNVIGKSLLSKAPTLNNAANVKLPVMTCSLPSRPETFDALYLGLTGFSTKAGCLSKTITGHESLQGK